MLQKKNPVRTLRETVLCACLLVAPMPLLARNPDARPASVRIVNVPREQRGYGILIGNIRVRYRDGRSETWTSGGKCMIAKATRSGLVGWTRYTMRNDYGEPVNCTVRIRFLDGRVKDYDVQSGPFIDDWALTDGETTLVIVSAYRHGPSYLIKYDLRSGEVLGTTRESRPPDEIPEWAKRFLQPR